VLIHSLLYIFVSTINRNEEYSTHLQQKRERKKQIILVIIIITIVISLKHVKSRFIIQYLEYYRASHKKNLCLFIMNNIYVKNISTRRFTTCDCFTLLFTNQPVPKSFRARTFEALFWTISSRVD
jgi:uncharacterized membrane protein YwzB